MSLTVSVLLLLPVLNKKYVKPDVSENSTVGCVICASGRLMRVTHFNQQVNVSVFVGRKHSSGEQEPSTLPSPPLLSAADDRSQVSSAGLAQSLLLLPRGVGLHRAGSWKSTWISTLLTSVES